MTAFYAVTLQPGQMSERGVETGLGTMTVGIGGVGTNFSQKSAWLVRCWG